ncbi:MAG: molecular chaperone, partial [Microthrixaceae bacterium]
LDRALWRRGYRPTSLSKYATGLAALDPDLPRNRWARILRGPIASAQSATERTAQCSDAA